jgi:hypothetical protein
MFSLKSYMLPNLLSHNIGCETHIWSGSDLEVGVAMGDICGCAVGTASTMGGGGGGRSQGQ